MGAQVEIINNPYIQRVRILINGEAVSVYSNLEKFMDEPFSYWCDKIWDSIYEECNYGEFSLHFSSRKEELEIMELLAQNYPHCTDYSHSPLIRPTPLLERIKELNTLIRSIRSSGYYTFSKNALFVIPERLKRLENDLIGLEIKNSFCQINTQVIYYQEFLLKRTNQDVVFLLSDDKTVQESMLRLGIDRDFGIHIGQTVSFLQKRNDMFIYETTEDYLFDTIFNCLLLSPLLTMFNSCINSLSPEIRKKYSGKIEELQSISLKIIPVPESNKIEIGISSRIHFKTDLKGYEVRGSDLHYSYSEKGIISCNGLLVEGLKPGKVTLYIYKKGEQTPSASVDYTVIKRNRIVELKVDEDIINMGEGDRMKLNYTFLPVDADNGNSIEWHSDNASIAKIDSNGYVQAISRGTCTIRCYAEKICDSCRCIVKPYLQSIVSDVDEMEMIYGQEQEIKIKLSPNDCIDDQIIFASLDMGIANIVGRTVKATGLGKTKIVVQNKQETVRKEITVHVMTEKELKKLFRQREKNAVAKTKKKSLLSKLFS